ncbi:MAG: sugar phosphate isomerase/epimerase family protein [Candidatus Latescibacterota bacterium]
MSIKYCLNSSTIRPVSLMEKIQIAGQTGYEAIELWNDDLTAHQECGGSLKDVKQALGDHGLAVPTVIAVHGWLGSEGAVHAVALEEAKRKMEQAVEVGAEFVIASPPMDPFDLSRGGADYRELLEIGRGIGVRPAMEYLGFMKSVYTIEQAWQIVQDADHPDSSMIMDPFHILRGGGSIESIAKIPAHKVAIWHWNDAPGDKPFAEQSDADRVMPGDGVGPLEEMKRLALAQGYDGFVSLELFSPALWEKDPAEVAKIGMQKMQGYFAG